MFGNLPKKNKIIHLIYQIFGYPNNIRRLQAPTIFQYLNLNKKDSVIDIGCADGMFTWEIGKKAKKVVGIDLPKIIGEQHKLIESYNKRISFIKGDALKLPLKEKTFNKVLLSSVLQMVSNDIALLQEIKRILAPKGYLVLSVPVNNYTFPRLQKRQEVLKKKFSSKGCLFYDKKKLFNLLENSGFHIIKYTYSPKKWASKIFELQVLIADLLHLPLTHKVYFYLFYPIMIFDKFCSNKSEGLEIILLAQKIS